MRRFVVSVLTTACLLTSAGVMGGTALALEADSVGEANNAFALDLYGALRERPGNLFFSPYSVWSAVAMTEQGARGETEAQMERVLHAGDVEGSDHAALVKALEPGRVRDGFGEEAEEVPTFELDVANAVWVQEKLGIEDRFAKTLEEDFGAPLCRIDFRRTEEARATINGWVEEKTRGRIEDIVPAGMPTRETRLSLANAIWFKAAWAEPFQEEATRPDSFTTDEGDTVDVPFMHRSGELRYAEDDDVQIVEMPYRAGETSMLVVLPKQKGGLPAVESRLDGPTMEGWLAELTPRRVSLKFPRFEVTQSAELAPVLAALGMAKAFEPGEADFTGITTEEPLFISAVLHKAFVAVDEAGTEAAAATVAMMSKTSILPGEPVELVADHPFLYLIRHRDTGAILFMGRLVRPAE